MNTWKELSFFVVLSLDSKKYDFTIYGIHTTKPVVSLVAYFLSGPQLSTQRPLSVQRYTQQLSPHLLIIRIPSDNGSSSYLRQPGAPRTSRLRRGPGGCRRERICLQVLPPGWLAGGYC